MLLRDGDPRAGTRRAGSAPVHPGRPGHAGAAKRMAARAGHGIERDAPGVEGGPSRARHHRRPADDPGGRRRPAAAGGEGAAHRADRGQPERREPLRPAPRVRAADRAPARDGRDRRRRSSTSSGSSASGSSCWCSTRSSASSNPSSSTRSRTRRSTTSCSARAPRAATGPIQMVTSLTTHHHAPARQRRRRHRAVRRSSRCCWRWCCSPRVPLLAAARREQPRGYDFEYALTPRNRERGYLMEILTGPRRRQGDPRVQRDALPARAATTRSSRSASRCSRAFAHGRFRVSCARRGLERRWGPRSRWARSPSCSANGSIDVATAVIAGAAMQAAELAAPERAQPAASASCVETGLFLDDFRAFLRLGARGAAWRSRRRRPTPRRCPSSAASSSRTSRSSTRTRTETVLQRRLDATSAPARSSRWSARTARARRRWSSSSAALYQPAAGRHALGRPARYDELDPAVVRSEITVLFQDFLQYELSVGDNIALGRVEREPRRRR